MAAAADDPAHRRLDAQEPLPRLEPPSLPVFVHRGTVREALVNSPTWSRLGGPLRPDSAAAPFVVPQPSSARRARPSTGRRAHVNAEDHHTWQLRPLSVRSGRISTASLGTGVLPLPQPEPEPKQPQPWHELGSNSALPRSHLTPWLSHVSAHGDDRLAARWSATRTGAAAAAQLQSPRSASAVSSSHSSPHQGGHTRRHPRRRSPQRSARAVHDARSYPPPRNGAGRDELAAAWSLTSGSLWDDDPSTVPARYAFFRVFCRHLLPQFLGHLSLSLRFLDSIEGWK